MSFSRSSSKRRCLTLRPWRRTSLSASMPILMCFSTKLLVTLRSHLAPLRSQFLFPVVRLALLRAGRRASTRFRVVHFSVQRDHLHLIVEARDKRALSSGMRSVAIRVARYVNDVLSRRGALWAERWHG